jgi:hypothetical protein
MGDWFYEMLLSLFPFCESLLPIWFVVKVNYIKNVDACGVAKMETIILEFSNIVYETVYGIY